jgi:hypothetical protein
MYTLIDYAANSNNPLVTSFVRQWMNLGTPWLDVPLTTKASLTAVGAVYPEGPQSTHTINWRPIGGSPAESKIRGKAHSERAYALSNIVSIDHFLAEDKNRITDPLAEQLRTYIDQSAYTLSDMLFNNNHVSGNVDSFVGLRARLDNPLTYEIPSEMKMTPGSAIDMTSTATASDVRTFLSYLHEAMENMGNPMGTGITMYVNVALWEAINRGISLLGTNGGFNTVTDQYGRSITRYRDLQIKTVGRLADNTTQIIKSTETLSGADGSSNHTSAYFVNWGAETFFGWQFKELADSILYIPRSSDPNGIAERVVIDWAVGLFLQKGRSLARLTGVQV